MDAHRGGWTPSGAVTCKRRMSEARHAMGMDFKRIGLAFRALRRHQGLRQVDVARRAGVSQQHVSDLERGSIAPMAIGDVERLLDAVGARMVVRVSWRGAELDRMLDEDHAGLCQVIADRLRSWGWTVIPEATYSIYGERGSVDLLALHPGSLTLLVIEVKTEVASAEEMLRRHDAKVRLGPAIARDRLGVTPVRVARLLVVADSITNRRRVARLSGLLGTAYPDRGDTVRRWLRGPVGQMSGLVFTRIAQGGARVRVRRTHARSTPSAPAGAVSEAQELPTTAAGGI